MKKYIAVLSMSLVLGASSGVYAGGGEAKGQTKEDKDAMKAKVAEAAKAAAAAKEKVLALGKSKTASCIGCHSADGNSVVPANPKLAGQNAAYLIKQLNDFASGKRLDGPIGGEQKKGPKYGTTPGVMNGIAKTLKKEDIVLIANYFAAQKIKPGLASTDLKTLNKENLKALGKKLYIGGNMKTGVPACMGCHGPAGKGNNAALYPAIGGQHSAYTEAQLKHFRTAGLSWKAHINAKKVAPKDRAGRKNDKEFRMQAVVLRLTDIEIKALASYLQGLRVAK